MSNYSSSKFNRRKFVRASYPQEVKCKKVCRPESNTVIELSEPLDLLSVDLSLGGISFTSNTEIEEGTILNFNYTIDITTYELSTIVVYCIPFNNSYRIGVEFTSLDKDLEEHIKKVVARLTYKL